mmetsp:Transcript_45736/g.74607  ORF Transcript_45736/g.74607 Transcript_45736/m.74607 type:complete len:216 (+) Transcript_45736:214-861(+)
MVGVQASPFSRGFAGIVKTCLAVSGAMMTGDVGCQMLSSGNGSTIDVARTARMGVTGLVVAGPWGYCQNHFLEYIVPGRSTPAVLKKVAMGGLFISPISISLTFTSLTLLRGKSISDVREKIRQDVPSTWVAGLLFWPFISFMNFRYVSVPRRPFVGSVAGVIWGLYMSGQANKAVGQPRPSYATLPKGQEMAMKPVAESQPSSSLPGIALALHT